jgi:hypothetical protein
VASVDILLLICGAGQAVPAPLLTKFPVNHNDIPVLNVPIIPQRS